MSGRSDGQSYEVMGGGEADEGGGSGGTDCHQAAVRLCWPAVCYLLQHWLGSQRGPCKVGQHIIYLPPSSAPPLTHYLILFIMQPLH